MHWENSRNLSKIDTKQETFTFFLDLFIQIVDVNCLIRRDIAGKHRYHRQSQPKRDSKNPFTSASAAGKSRIQCESHISSLSVYDIYGRLSNVDHTMIRKMDGWDHLISATTKMEEPLEISFGGTAIATLIESNTTHSDRFVLEQLSDLLKSRPWIAFMASNDPKMDMNLQVQIQHSVTKKKKVSVRTS